MLNIQRRHVCKDGRGQKRDEWDAGYTKCSCPVIIRGTLGGRRVTKGLKRFLPAAYHSLETARALAMLWERKGCVYPPELQEIITNEGSALPSSTDAAKDKRSLKGETLIVTAVDVYIAHAVSAGNGRNTLRKKRTVFSTGHESLKTFAETGHYRFVSEIDATFLQLWRASWSLKELARHKRQCQVIGFLWFCQRSKWLPANYADEMTMALGRIQVPPSQTGYFPPTEFKRILDATYAYATPTDELSGEGIGGERLRALIQLMRWTGLAIRDAVSLERSRIQTDAGTGVTSVAVRRKKTKEWVYCPIPPHVIELIQSVPPGPRSQQSPYFFWTGRGTIDCVVGNWHRAFAKLFDLADIRDEVGNRKKTGSHMFRDTFAVESLLSGIRIEMVADLLGHSSIKTTEESYMPFVLARQACINEAVVGSWSTQGIIENPNPKRLPRPLKIVARKAS